MASSPIHFVDLTVDPDNVVDTITPLLKTLRPEWELDELCVDTFSRGVVNNMCCIYTKDDPGRDDGMIVRLYGMQVADLNPRDKEFLSLQVAHAAGSFPPIYAAFNNGLVYKFAPGRVMTYHELTDPAIIPLITRQLYRLHHAQVDSLTLFDRKGKAACYGKAVKKFSDLQKSMSSIPKRAMDPHKDKRFQEFRKEISDKFLQTEFTMLNSVLEKLELPVAMVHNDFHGGNIIYDDKSKAVIIIDYEMAGFGNQYQEMSRMFLSKPFLDLFKVTKEDEPEFSPEVRACWLDSYLAAMKVGKDLPDEAWELERQILDVGHSIMETVSLFEVMVLTLSHVDLDVKIDFMDTLEMCKEWYLSRKDDLPHLQEEYLTLKFKRVASKW